MVQKVLVILHWYWKIAEPTDMSIECISWNSFALKHHYITVGFVDRTWQPYFKHFRIKIKHHWTALFFSPHKEFFRLAALFLSADGVGILLQYALVISFSKTNVCLAVLTLNLKPVVSILVNSKASLLIPVFFSSPLFRSVVWTGEVRKQSVLVLQARLYWSFPLKIMKLNRISRF